VVGSYNDLNGEELDHEDDDDYDPNMEEYEVCFGDGARLAWVSPSEMVLIQRGPAHWLYGRNK